MKTLNITIIITLLSVISIQFSKAQIQFAEIENAGDWQEIVANSENTKRPVFLDIYATWCGPCKYLDRTVYTDSALASIFNREFVNARLDGESEFGRIMVGRYGLHAYPTMYFLNSAEKVITSIVGVREAPELAETGNIIAENFMKIIQFENKLAENKLDNREMSEYHALLLSLGQNEKAARLSDSIISALSDKEILDPSYKSIIAGSITDLDGRIFSVIKNNRQKAFEVWGNDTAELFLNNIYNASLGKAIGERDSAYMERIISEVLPVYLGSDSADMDYVRDITHKIYYANTASWKNYQDLIFKGYHASQVNADEYLYKEAYELVKEYGQNPEAVGLAALLMDEALNAKRNPKNLMMTAYIEGVRGNFELAEKFLAEAGTMEMTDQEKAMLEELKKITSQSKQEKPTLP